MDLASFDYKGKKYKVDKVTALEPKADNMGFQIITKDNKKFKIKFEESIFKWVLTESPN